MASRTITTLTDDIDGSDADETITFAFKGMTYEIDLSKKNLDRMVKPSSPTPPPPAPPAADDAPAPAAPPTAAPTGTSSPRSATGPAPTAITSPTAAASAPPSRALQRRQLKTHQTRKPPIPVRGWAASPSSRRAGSSGTKPAPAFNIVTPDKVQTRFRMVSLEFQVSLPVTRTVGRLRHLVLVGPRRWAWAVRSLELRWWPQRPATAGRTMLSHCRTLRIPPLSQSLFR